MHRWLILIYERYKKKDDEMRKETVKKEENVEQKEVLRNGMMQNEKRK